MQLVYGATRMVILTGNIAIKIPRFVNCNEFYGVVSNVLDGWSANRTEYKWSKANVHEFLCRVQSSFFFSFIIVMERADVITMDEFAGLDLDVFNFWFEKKADSFGRNSSNKIVVVDYG